MLYIQKCPRIIKDIQDVRVYNKTVNLRICYKFRISRANRERDFHDLFGNLFELLIIPVCCTESQNKLDRSNSILFGNNKYSECIVPF